MNIKVKELAWVGSEHLPFPRWATCAASMNFHAIINTTRPKEFGKFPLTIDGADCGKAPQTLEEAKAIAQGVFERRVMDVIENYTDIPKPIDWTAPLELLDGTPVKLEAPEALAASVSNGMYGGPDPDGDYWVIREDGEQIASVDSDRLFHSMCYHPDGCEEGTRIVNVRNRA